MGSHARKDKKVKYQKLKISKILRNTITHVSYVKDDGSPLCSHSWEHYS